MAPDLETNGWRPTILTVDPRDYEEVCDPLSSKLLPSNVAVEYVRAWPAGICRFFGLGDLSLRAQYTLRRKVTKLISEGKVDLIFATVLPGYTSLIGAWAKRRFGLPFVLDYQDPWVSHWG